MISGVRVLVSVRGVVTVGTPPPGEGLWLWLWWLAVRAAALVYTARVEEELGGTVRRTVAAVMDPAVAPVMVLLGRGDEGGGGGDVVAGVTFVVDEVALRLFSSVE